MPMSKKHFTAIIRHGERGDRVEGAKGFGYIIDPPLTAQGVKEAQHTGDFLRDYFELKG